MDFQVNGHGRSDTEATIVGEPAGKSKAPLTAHPEGTTVPPIIPPEHPSRTLVLCFDGTGDQFDSDNSNIVTFFSLLKKDDRGTQLVYYQAGIGTYTTPQIATPMMSKMSKMMDEAIAWNLDAHVIGGYEFLMQNYIVGDRICIFGFSRGAYTARSLAGMIHKVGILPACNHQQVPFAYKMYTSTDEVGWTQSNAFKETFSVHAQIEFVGVWDTVNSVGLIPKRLPFSTSNTIVHTFRHALSLDERRAKFKANLWNRPTPQEQTLSITDKQIQNKKLQPVHQNQKSPSQGDFQRDMERKYSSRDPAQPTDVEEVWFAGCHCDVGGGSVGNDVPNTLAAIPLRWMIRECFKTKTGIMFESEGLRKIGMDPHALWPEVLPRPPALPLPQGARIESIPRAVKPSNTQREMLLPNFANAESQTVTVHPTEEELELKDALSPIYDQLQLAWFWWILEFLPIKQRYQKGDNTWASYIGWNMGRGRFIPKQQSWGVKVHRSVKMRLEAVHEDGTKYSPKAAFSPECVTWID